MPFTQIEDILDFNNTERKVRAKGTLWRPQDLECTAQHGIEDENFRTFTVRVCQGHGGGRMIAEKSVDGMSADTFPGDGTWNLDLDIEPGHQFNNDMHGCATAVLIYEAGGDLFSLTWAECVQFRKEAGS